MTRTTDTTTPTAAVRHRDAGLSRLRRLTLVCAGGAAVLTGVFAAVAAGTTGRATSHRTVAAPAPTPAATPAPAAARGPGAHYPAQSESAAAPSGSSASSSAQAIQQPQQAPVPSYSAPVAVSGGS
jgi:hypothetical protein